MAEQWTDADQRQYDALAAQEKSLEAQIAGDPVANAHVAAVSKPIKPHDEATLPFSPIRTLIGTGRDIVENALDTGRDIVTTMSTPIGDALTSVVRGDPLRALNDITSGGQLDKPRVDLGNKAIIPDVPGSDEAGTAEKIVRGIASFAVPYAGWSKKLGVAKAGIGLLERLGRGAAAGAVTDFVNQAPDTTNMASIIKDTFGIDNQTLDYLSYHEDEQDIVSRLKAAATNVPVGIAADGLFELGAKAIRAYRAVKGGAEEGRSIVTAMEHDYGIKGVEPSVAPGSADAEAGGASAVVPPTPSQEPFNASIHTAIQEAQPKSWEDITAFLERTVNDPKLKDEELQQLAKILENDPENALRRMGIEPAKLDWHEFENPDGIKNLHQSLINIYEKIGQRLGRTGETVAEDQIHTAARAWASDADILKTLYGATKNLPEILMGARMFVGSHAHTLLGSAQDTLAALRESDAKVSSAPAEAAWQNFLGAFHRHALYLGTVRGAGSEIGRALKSLQFVARTDVQGAAKFDAKDLEAKVMSAEMKGQAGADEALSEVSKIEDPAERMMLLSKLLEKDGDIGQLNQFIRGQAGSVSKRLDGMMRESISNLFSAGTAAYNIKSGLTMLTFRGMARWMAAAARAPLALMGGEQARNFRVAAMDAWYYTDGVIGTVAEAVNKTLKTLERDASAEMYINVDNLGLKGLAKVAANANADAAKALGTQNFERVDLSEGVARQMAFNPMDRKALDDLMDTETMPALVFRALQLVTRSVGAAANAAGTITRLGTILFINGPDQFVGTMAAKAGMQSAAIRLAAARAAELGIEGPALTKYLKARVASLASDPTGWSDQGFEDGYRQTLAAAGEHEARAALYQDAIESPHLRQLSRAIGRTKFLSLVIPFPHTPLRILENTALDYTPLKLLTRKYRQAILHGTPQQRDEGLSRLGLGMFMMGLGYKLWSNRNEVGIDNNFQSTSRLDRESYTMRIGGDVYQFNRDAPAGILMGLAADYHAYMSSVDKDDPEAEAKGASIIHAGALAISANVLSQTWLQELKNMTDLIGTIGNDKQFVKGFDRYVTQTAARRFVPAAGIQETINKAVDPWEREALSFSDEMVKYTVGANTLPQKINWLGDPEPKNLGERFVGLTWKPEEGRKDKLIGELDRLSMPDPLPAKQIKGVDLNAQQYSRLLQLRGNGVVRDYGTMKQALTQLVNHPGYGQLTDPAKETAIKQLTQGYTKDATNQLLKEDPELLARVIRKVNYDRARAMGAHQDQLRQQNATLGKALGLTP